MRGTDNSRFYLVRASGRAGVHKNEMRRAGLFLLLVASLTFASQLPERTVAAFDDYVKRVEARMDSKVLESRSELKTRVQNGEIVAFPFAHREAGHVASVQVPEGLINHWFGGMFLPGRTVEQVRAVLQDYGNYSKIYQPDVAESRLEKASGDEFDIFLRLYRHVKVKALLGLNFPVEFNSNYHVRYSKLGNMLMVRSVSTRIAEVKDPKKTHTLEYEIGRDHGYLWRLRSYWRVYPTQGGVFVECEAVSLSRSVPGFVEKMVTYFTTNFPEDSMRHTLAATKEAVAANK